jgi:Protein of unknown function (DUF1329)
MLIKQRKLRSFSSVNSINLAVLFAISFAAAIYLTPSAAGAQQVLPTRSDYAVWLHKYMNATPSFKPGDVLTQKDIERIRPFVPPGYLEQLNFPGLRMEIGAPEDHTPRQDFMNCTEKYQSQVRLGPGGELENYVCGQPFSDALSTSDAMAGFKAAWNYEWRWQNFGLACYTLPWIWVRFGGTHSPFEIEKDVSWDTGTGYHGELPNSGQVAKMFQGGGSFQRILQSTYQRVYFSHLAPMADRGGLLPVPGAKDFEFKEFTGFFDPFDIRGTAFIVYRYSDPRRQDDAWAYLPVLRRVRRISVEVKSDSLLGTDHTLEDFYGFSGRILEWKWKFLGWKNMLAVMSSKYDYAHYFGPNGIIPNDRWTVRRFAVVERTPTIPRHPYSSAIDFWDAQNWDTSYLIAFDHSRKLWKIFQFTKVWSEDFKDPNLQRINKGVRATDFQTIAVMDLQNHRATLNPIYGLGFPTVTAQHVEKLYDVSSLEQIHR